MVKAVDCGIFLDGKRPTYPRLFKLYDEMGADYGVMKDILGDPAKTLDSAKRAVDIYWRQKRRFELVLVAQGRSAEQYVTSCKQLATLGIGQLAIGGLLVRKERSARYSSAGTLERIDSILSAVRKAFPERWLFVLGCYHAKRHPLFEKHRIYGSDYKGWIFNYVHRLDRLAEVHEQLLEYERKLRPRDSLTNEATERHDLWLNAAEARTNYAVTKNRSQKESDQKAKYRKELQGLLSKIENIDRLLAQARHEEALRDDLPRGYKSLVSTYQRLVKRTDQEARVAGIHDYLKAEILPKITQRHAADK